jgi:hypothetical protein
MRSNAGCNTDNAAASPSAAQRLPLKVRTAALASANVLSGCTRDQLFATEGNPVIGWCQQPQIGGTHVGGVSTCASAANERNGSTTFIKRVIVNIADLENAGVTP